MPPTFGIGVCENRLGRTGVRPGAVLKLKCRRYDEPTTPRNRATGSAETDGSIKPANYEAPCVDVVTSLRLLECPLRVFHGAVTLRTLCLASRCLGSRFGVCTSRPQLLARHRCNHPGSRTLPAPQLSRPFRAQPQNQREQLPHRRPLRQHLPFAQRRLRPWNPIPRTSHQSPHPMMHHWKEAFRSRPLARVSQQLRQAQHLSPNRLQPLSRQLIRPPCAEGPSRESAAQMYPLCKALSSIMALRAVARSPPLRVLWLWGFKKASRIAFAL